MTEPLPVMPIDYSNNKLSGGLMFSVALALFLHLGIASSAGAADVLLMSDGVRGQGTLQRRGNECLIITPRHVVENSISDIVATFPDRREVLATILELYAEDIALLRLASQPAGGCPDNAFNGDKLSKLLQSATEGVLKRRDETGAASLLQVDIVGFDEHRFVRVEPRSKTKSIKQGYSGSVLFINNQAIGMLVNNESADSETGLALRAEMINATIDPFFQAAQGDRSFHVTLDTVSEFLSPDFQAMARTEKLAIASSPDNSSFRLQVSSEVSKLDSDTDKIVNYNTRLLVLDKLDRTVVDQQVKASGNSFVSLASAQQNAQAQLREQLRQSDFLQQLP